jgi:hypothetical protein
LCFGLWVEAKPNSTISTEGKHKANYNFGMAPNRLLIKALKKAVNFEK